MKYSLPKSAVDLLIKDGKLLMRSVSVYEVLRRFGHIIRLTPFRFEDFSSALLAEEQSPLIAEIHIQLLRTLIREDRQQQTWLGPPDLRDSVNIYLHLADHANWTAALRIYLSADPKENSTIIEKLEGSGPKCYPFNVDIELKLEVLEQLCDQFLLSNLAREEILNGSSTVDKHDSICRLCSKANGDLVPCGNCPAVYHLKCSDPPLEKYPDQENEEAYLCAICRSNHITGVSDCIDPNESNGNFKRHEALCMDKLGRRYWFLIRRLFVVDEFEEDVRYYTTQEQLGEMIDSLKGSHEKGLIESLKEQRDEIERQMKITEDLYQSILKNNKNEDGSYSQFLGQDGAHKNYVNHYSSSNLAMSKNQHSDREINRSLGNKFSMSSMNSFKWYGAINGHLTTLTITIKSTILKFEAMLPQTFIHPCWFSQKSNWIKSANNAQGPEDFAVALSQLEASIKPVLFKSAWYETVGFSQLFRSTSAEREELKKTDRQPRGFERREWFSQDFELSYRLGTMVKFSPKLKPVKHQVWKQKGEEYRLTGLNGWFWRSNTFKSNLRSKPKLYKIEPFKLLEFSSNESASAEDTIKSADVVDVATNLSYEDSRRVLYPKKPQLSEYKQKRVSKLEGLLKTKLQSIEKSTALKENESEPAHDAAKLVDGQKIKIENGGDSVAIPIDPTKNLVNGNGDGTKKIIFYSQPTSDNGTSSPKINLLTAVFKSQPQQQQQQQIIKKCIFAKPKLPPCHDFLTKRGKKRSILVLPDIELHKLARSGGMRETKSFSYTAKQNSYVWPYGMTPRPTFRTCWLYRNRLINTIQDVGLQLKVIYASIRWDELQVKPPATGHNVITTEDSTITIELMKKRDKLPYLTHSEYLIKKTVTPFEQPTKYRKVQTKNSTPSARSGLRARRKTEDDEEKGPTTEEVWVSEDQLELWELKQFDERIERQNQLMREKAMREEAERRRRIMIEEEKKRKAEQARRKAEEDTRRVSLTQATNSSGNTNPQTPKPGISTPVQARSPTTPVLRYFRTEQGQIIRLPASYLQRGTPLILRHVGPGLNQTNTYIIRPQITPIQTNIVLNTPTPAVNAGATTTTPVIAVMPTTQVAQAIPTPAAQPLAQAPSPAKKEPDPPVALAQSVSTENCASTKLGTDTAPSAKAEPSVSATTEHCVNTEQSVGTVVNEMAHDSRAPTT